MAFERVQMDKGIRLVGEDRQKIGSRIAPALGAMPLDKVSAHHLDALHCSQRRVVYPPQPTCRYTASFRRPWPRPSDGAG